MYLSDSIEKFKIVFTLGLRLNYFHEMRNICFSLYSFPKSRHQNNGHQQLERVLLDKFSNEVSQFRRGSLGLCCVMLIVLSLVFTQEKNNESCFFTPLFLKKKKFILKIPSIRAKVCDASSISMLLTCYIPEG